MTNLAIGGPFDIGDEVLIVANVTDVDDDPADPSAITLQILPPTGTVIAKNLGDMSNPSTGLWTYAYLIDDDPGVWTVRFRGTAAILTAAEGSFVVRPSAFATP